MNEDIVRRWNSVVGRHDEVWLIGDLAMGKINESLFYVKELHGHLKMVPGNHDRMFGTHGTKRADTEAMYLRAGIEEILPEETETWIGGTSYLVNHFPYSGESRDGTEDRFQESRSIDNGRPLIHGHVHDTWRKRANMVNVGIDAWAGYPIHEDEVAHAFLEDGDLPIKNWTAA